MNCLRFPISWISWAAVAGVTIGVYLLHICGILDSEIGARWNPHGISIYISLPYFERQTRTFIICWVTVTCLASINVVRNLIRSQINSRIVVLKMLILGANCHMLLRYIESPVRARKNHYVYRSRTLYQIRQKLTLQEYLASHECENEISIQRSMQLISTGPVWPEINRTAMALYTEHLARNKDGTHIARVQLVGGGVYVTVLNDNEAFHVDGRLQAVVKAILTVSRECVLSDSEFFLDIDDGFERSCWPARTDGGLVYAPVFVQEKPRKNPGILTTPRSLGIDWPYGFSKDLNYFADLSLASSRDNHIAWNKKIQKAVWRGSPTGGYFEESNWQSFPRSKVVALSLKRPDLLDARFVHVHGSNQASAGALGAMHKAGMFGTSLSHEDQLVYKAIIVVDGNSVADRFPWQLASNAVIFKQDSDKEEFWYDELVPWVHYIPFGTDASDLEERLGAVLGNDTMMQEVAAAGNLFALRRLTPRRMGCYWAQLLGEYSRHVEQPVVPLPGAQHLEVA